MTTTSEIPIVIRAATPADEGLIVSSYLRSYRLEGNNSYMSNDVYYAQHKPRGEAMARGPALIACNPEDEWHVYGWLAYSRSPIRIEYAYVKFPFRRMGVFRRLFERANPAGLPVSVTHTGRCFAELRKRFGFAFNPESERP